MDDLKNLLEASDGPRQLTPDEDRRIREQLGLELPSREGGGLRLVELDADRDPAVHVEDIGVPDQARPAKPVLVRALPYLASAAAVLLLVLVIGTRRDQALRRSREPEERRTSPNSCAPTSKPPQH